MIKKNEEHSMIVMDNALYHSCKKFPTVIGKKKIFNIGYIKRDRLLHIVKQ